MSAHASVILPIAYCGCTCDCHRIPGVSHVVACCMPTLRERQAIDYEERRQRSRQIFETWIKTSLPKHWPNPDSDGTYVHMDGSYHNKALDLMWTAWKASEEYLSD